MVSFLWHEFHGIGCRFVQVMPQDLPELILLEFLPLDKFLAYSSFLPLTTSRSLAMAVPQCFSSRPRLWRPGSMTTSREET